MMQELNFPAYSFKINTLGAKPQIFDTVRKKWVALTPEEWVRQHVLQYLFTEKGYPLSLTAVEAAIDLHGMRRRCDVICHTSEGKPLLVVECKAPGVKITQAVFDQAWRYHFSLQVSALMLTNGLSHYIAIVHPGNPAPVYTPVLPSYSELLVS